ncbi:MAG: M48 family metalloprotease, partial [Sedimenticolaceae bacterium]
GQAALIQQQINFTRANEKEADRVGIDILNEAGFEPRAMPSFFARMGKATRVYDSKLPEFLMTHPVTTSRTADALGRAEQFPYRQNPLNLSYELARINLLQRQIPRPEDAIDELGGMLEDGRFRNESAVRYGIALAQIRAKRLSDASGNLRQLRQTHPEVIEFVATLAQAEALQGNGDAALRLLVQALADHPGSYALNVIYAEIALGLGAPDKAEEKLLRFLDYQDEEPLVYQLLARAAGDRGEQALGHQRLSDYYYLIGDLEAAILQLEIALKTQELNFFDASRLEARLAQLKREQDESETGDRK